MILILVFQTICTHTHMHKKKVCCYYQNSPSSSVTKPSFVLFSGVTLFHSEELITRQYIVYVKSGENVITLNIDMKLIYENKGNKLQV